MRSYIYFSFIIYIGLLASEFAMSPLYDYIEGRDVVFTIDLFFNPIKFSLVGGAILVVVNKIFPTKTNKKND